MKDVIEERIYKNSLIGQAITPLKTNDYSILDNMLEGCQIIGFDWRYIYLNDAADIHNRRPKKELIGKKYMDMWPGIENTDISRIIKHCMEERGHSHIENEFLFPDGTSGWFDLIINPVPDGVFILSIDITERKSKLEAGNNKILREIKKQNGLKDILLKHSEEQQIIFDSIPAWVYYKDKENRFIKVNKAFSEIMGTAKDQLENKSLFDIYPREQAEAYWKDDKEVMATGTPKKNIIEEMKSPKGTIWVQSDKIPYYDARGVIIGIIGFTIVITKRILAEEKIKKLNEYLKANIIKTEAANKELEAFSYSVSHDLRAPLRAIDGFSKVLMESKANNIDSEAKRYLNIIRTNTQNMGKLIDDLLSFSRVGKQEMRLSLVNMELMAMEILDELKLQNPGRNIGFIIKNSPQTMADAILIKIVLINLLNNAVKYTRLKKEAAIEFGGSIEDNENIYYIKDNGAGFDMKYIGKLFGVFQRLHSQEEFEGTGVGLALVQRIIQRHSGRVWAEGSVNDGAVFYFTLPNLKKEEINEQ